MWKKVRFYSSVFLFYILIAGLAMYRVLLNPGHLPGQKIDGYFVTDFYHFHWNYWWIQHALTTPGLSVYETDYVMFPHVSNLGLHTMAPFYFPVWAVLEPIWGSMTAVNIIIILGLALTGFSFFVLARRWQVRPGLALLGGLVLQLSPGSWNAIYMSTLHYLSIFWIPAHLLLWEQVVKNSSQWRKALFWSILMGLSVWGTLLTDPQTLLYSATLILPLGTWYLIKSNWQDRIHQVGWGIFVLSLALLLGWYLGPLQPTFHFDQAQLNPPDYTGAYVIPFPHAFYSWIPEYWVTSKNLSMGAFVLPATFFSMLIGLLTWKRENSRVKWAWLGLGLLPLTFAAGGTLEINGTEIALPYRLLHEALGGMFRQPARFVNIFIIGGMLFSGMLWSKLLKKHHYLWFSVGVLLLVLADSHVYQSLPSQTPPPAYQFYAEMGQEQGADYGDYVILDVPTAGASGETAIGKPQALTTQYYAITHHKRTVNGLIARVPNGYFWYMRTDDPLLSWLGQRRYLEPELVEAQLTQRIYDWPIGYIVIHQDIVGLHQPASQEIIGYFNQLDDLLCPYAIEGDAVVYRTRWHPDGCPARTPPQTASGVYTIDIGADGDERFIGWGFHWQEALFDTWMRWTGEYPQADLYLDLPPASYELSFEAQAFVEERTVDILVNERYVDTVTVIPDALGNYTATIPAEYLGDGQHIQVSLVYDGWIVPVEAGLNSDPRKLAIMLRWVQFSQID